jgi:hypothetical protein
LARLHDDGCERNTAGNRELHYDQYCMLVLLFLYRENRAGENRGHSTFLPPSGAAAAGLRWRKRQCFSAGACDCELQISVERVT